MKTLLARLISEEGGQDLVEYALLVGFIALAVLTTIQALGTALDTSYQNINTQVGTIPGGGGS